MSNSESLVKYSLFSTADVVANNNVAVDVALATIKWGDLVFLKMQGAGAGANANSAYVVSITAGTGFRIVSGAADTSTYTYTVARPRM